MLLNSMLSIKHTCTLNSVCIESLMALHCDHASKILVVLLWVVFTFSRTLLYCVSTNTYSSVEKKNNHGYLEIVGINNNKNNKVILNGLK